MTTIFIHPAVTQYLAELDEALRNSPDQDSDELRDQVRTHIDDAVGPDATDQEIEATLRRLGPPGELVGDGSARPTRPAIVPTRPTFRGWLTSRSRRWWAVATVVVLGLAAVTTAVAVESHIAPLQAGCQPCGFLYQTDRVHVSSTSADGIDQDTVPVRYRQDQGFMFTIHNPSDFPQRVFGRVDDPDDSVTPTSTEISTISSHGLREPFTIRPGDFARDVTIPAHDTRQVVVHWVQNFCPGPSSYTTIDSAVIRVRTLGVTRTERVQIGMAFRVTGSRARGHCRYGATVLGVRR